MILLLFGFLPLSLTGQGAKSTPTVTWATPAAIIYGTALSSKQLDATASVAGTFAYAPAAGAVLMTGVNSLSVTFTPTDTAAYTTAKATIALAVDKATPTIKWATPAAITNGMALSATQLDASSATPGTFAYSPAGGTVLTAGSQTLSVTFTPTDTANYHDAAATVTLTVNKAVPALTWPAPNEIVYGTALSSTQLNATASVPGTFAYTPGAGAVPAPGANALSVTFTPTEATDYTTATKTVTLDVGPAITTQPFSQTVTDGSTATFSVVAGGVPTLTYQWQYLDGTTWKAFGAGTGYTTAILTTFATTAAYNGLQLRVAVADGHGFSTTSNPVKLTIAPVITTQPTSQTVTAGSSGIFSVVAAGVSTLTYQWQYLSGTTWKPFGAGTGYTTAKLTTFATTSAYSGLKLRVAVTDGDGLTATSNSVSLTVNKATPTITWATPGAIKYGTALSATQLNATSATPGTFAYSPVTGAVLTAGSQTLSATFTPTDTADYTTAKATVALTVNKATSAITWATPASITYGTALSATQLDASSAVAGTFVYNPTAGTVLPAGGQTLSVTFTPTDTTDYATATATVGLTVNKPTNLITWATPATITYGTPLSATQLDATSSVAGTFAYSPAAGTVLKAGAQTLSVTFTPTNTTEYSTSTATVTLTVNKAKASITWAAPAAIAYGTALSGTQLDASSAAAGTFAYTPAAGTVLKAGAQTLSVTFTPTDTTDYTTTTTTDTLTVNAVTPTITWTAPAAITYGTALSATQLDATSTVPGAFAYTPAAGTVLKTGAQSLSVTFTPTDTTDYATAKATVTLTVNVDTLTITWAAPGAITYGTALSATQLNATSTVAGAFAYNPAAGTVLKAGAQKLSVTFTPTDTTDYTTATATVALTVNAAAPAITWATPAGIAYGTPLSGTQLDATSTIAGGFVYSPAAGAVLAAGSQTLSVTFTPTDTTDYTTATQTVALTVSPTSSFVQAVAGSASGSANTLSLSFPANTFGGDLILVGFDFSVGAVSSVTDSQGNTFTHVGAQLTSPGGAQSVVYYAKNIKGGADTVTVTLSTNSPYILAYLTEYSGVDQTNPIDAQAGASGNAGPVSSGNATTTFAGDVIYGYCWGDGACTVGSGFAARSTFDNNLIEDITAGNSGSYGATGSATGGWTMQMVALKPASSVLPVSAPVITSATTASGTVGNAFSYQITATNAPTSYGATGLPAGLTVNSGTGLIAGTPTAAGTSTVALSATNTAGTGNATLTLAIATPIPTITSATTASGTVGSAFSYQITASNSPSSYGATGLPAGLTVNSGTGLISGTPTAAGTSTVALSATNTAGTGNATLTLAIATPIPTITSVTTASGTVGSAFSYQITASNTPSSYGATGLPAGLTVNSGTGLISGTPTAAGTSTVTLSATNSVGTGSATLMLTIAETGSSLSINATSVGFGSVALNTMTTQTVTLTSAGTLSVTVSSATVTGSGFSLAGSTFSATMAPGQTATLGVQFDPTTAGAATGQLTITSNSSTNGTAVIPLTGTGSSSTYAVDLSWDAPASSTDPIEGYNVFRALSGSSAYQLLNSSVDTQTTYTDGTAQAGQSYDYIIESVDDSGVESVPSNPIAVTIP